MLDDACHHDDNDELDDIKNKQRKIDLDDAMARRKSRRFSRILPQATEPLNNATRESEAKIIEDCFDSFCCTFLAWMTGIEAQWNSVLRYRRNICRRKDSKHKLSSDEIKKLRVILSKEERNRTSDDLKFVVLMIRKMNTRFFSRLNDYELRSIAVNFREELVCAGEQVYEVGDIGNHFYTIMEGSVGVYSPTMKLNTSAEPAATEIVADTFSNNESNSASEFSIKDKACGGKDTLNNVAYSKNISAKISHSSNDDHISETVFSSHSSSTAAAADAAKNHKHIRESCQAKSVVYRSPRSRNNYSLESKCTKINTRVNDRSSTNQECLLSSGMSFGERCLLDQKTRQNTACALADTCLLTMPKTCFRDALHTIHERETKRKISFFKSLPLTQRMPSIDVIKMALAFDVLQIQRETVVTNEGHLFDTLMLIENGAFEVRRRLLDNRLISSSSLTMCSLGPGCFIELNASINSVKASSSVICSSNGSVLMCSREKLQHTLSRNKSVLRRIQNFASVSHKKLQKDSAKIIQSLSQVSLNALYNQTVCLHNQELGNDRHNEAVHDQHHPHAVAHASAAYSPRLSSSNDTECGASKYPFRSKKNIFNDIVRSSNNFTCLPQKFASSVELVNPNTQKNFRTLQRHTHKVQLKTAVASKELDECKAKLDKLLLTKPKSTLMNDTESSVDTITSFPNVQWKNIYSGCATTNSVNDKESCRKPTPLHVRSDVHRLRRDVLTTPSIPPPCTTTSSRRRISSAYRTSKYELQIIDNASDVRQALQYRLVVLND